MLWLRDTLRLASGSERRLLYDRSEAAGPPRFTGDSLLGLNCPGVGGLGLCGNDATVLNFHRMEQSHYVMESVLYPATFRSLI